MPRPVITSPASAMVTPSIVLGPYPLPAALAFLLLVRPHQLRLRQNMALHRLLERRLLRRLLGRHQAVQGVQLEEVAMPADGRARAAVALTVPIVQAVARAFGQRLAAL